MKNYIFFQLFLVINTSWAYAANGACENWSSWTKPACRRLYQVFYEGRDELYVTGYAWHNRASYTSQRIKNYNEHAWGGGFGKGLYDEKGNWHGLYAIAFLDSHKNPEPLAGYAYLKTATINKDLKLGAGLSLFVTARPDIYDNIPFPGLLPWASISLYRASLIATYIPGSKGAGNVLFILGKWAF